MSRHTEAIRISKNFRRLYNRIRAAMESNDPDLVADAWVFYKNKMKKTYEQFTRMMVLVKDLYWQQQHLLEEIADLEKCKKRYYNEIERYQQAKSKQKELAYFTKEDEKLVTEEIRRKQAYLVVEKKKVDKKEQELLVKQDELEIAIRDTNLAINSYYRLSDTEIELFEKQRPLILEGVEKYGSISLAVQNNPKITLRKSAILYYSKKHQQFAQDLEIAMQVFKDSLDATVVDRAINGTVNPVFQKGEYIGDYAVKDNKLLIEVAKAKLPKEYNPRAYAAAHPQSVAGTTINILSFDGVDETKRGYARNIGVVKSVDDTGRVERITQQKKDVEQMLDYYRSKPGAEIIEGEVVSGSEE